MSCCGGNCGCGANCSCGNGCGGCKVFLEKFVEVSVFASTTSDVECYEEMSVAEENGCKCEGGYKCGDRCTCNPCNYN